MATSAFMDGGAIELRLDAPGGQLVGQAKIETTLTPGEETYAIDLSGFEGIHDLHVFFKGAAESSLPVAALTQLRFVRKGGS
jgi:hypothetical protein